MATATTLELSPHYPLDAAVVAMQPGVESAPAPLPPLRLTCGGLPIPHRWMGHQTLVPPAVFALALLASAQEPTQLPPVVVTGRGDSLTGTAATASEGTIGGDELRDRALLRPGEVLEAVPGVVITQHSGAGKSNQMFARGFNLDHGTDLATSLNGVGLNLPSHAHGQGYTDLNLVIPELIDAVRWRLGPYDVRDGDFGSAGAVDVDYVTHLDRGFVRLEAGSYGF